MAATSLQLSLCSVLLALAAGCNTNPGYPDEQVGFRDGLDDTTHSGERGSVQISEILWSGSITDDGNWDPTDIFIELRNEGNRPVNVSGWFLQVDGSMNRSWVIPTTSRKINVGEHVFIAAKNTGCFPEPDYIIEDLALPLGDPFRVKLSDRDERLIEYAGSRTMPPFAGGYDLVTSRSMERIEVMFGGRGTMPHMWHFFTDAEVEVPNTDRIATNCRTLTGASPGRANSPDYSGAFSTGSFE